ncbi:hypothetical protein EA462_10165 [Natrarchaeobius halalkaliphilus]|uniref:Uncharacterized protein n=1 Tax=Natrarchaeobius halalkaliphilus TaxID=1679091 RepID=A0A3N6NZF1_9EURY|nr:hypothetical protein [Natrarchaeobius halalkaliphilus]RQG90329.1 hypothetical protein EA462_10165 [Natrarchaeobius halalkaliphilus]
MGDGSGLKRVVVEEVGNQIDAGDLIGDGSIEAGIDGREVGASVGRSTGERIGRELGESIGRSIHEALEAGLEDEDTDIGSLRSALAEAVRDAIAESIGDNSAGDALESVTEPVTDDEEIPEDEAAGDDDVGDEESTSAPSGDDLEDLKRETLEDFLGLLSYEDLQSIAKDVDVPANLSREEMIDEILEAVSDEYEPIAESDEKSDSES